MGGKSSEITAGVLELVDEEDSKSFGVTLVWVRVPPPAPPSPRTAQVRGDFLCWKTVQNRVCRGHLGAVIQMRVDIRGCGNVAMPQPFLDVFQADTVRIKQTRAAMPLRYNYDKPEKPRISRVFGYLARFFILFQTEKSSREIVIS